MATVKETIYNALDTVIRETGLIPDENFERGYWHKKDCTNPANLPYAFLDQPDQTEMDNVLSPSGVGFEVSISLIAFTYNEDQGS